MVPPGPSPEELERILAIAARSPDHGKIAPWRFVIVGKEQREQLALLFRQALAEEDPCAGPVHHEKADQFARQGEALILLISSPVVGHKIPLWEQQLSVGAVAMNLLLAGHALGYVGGWLTGWQAYSPKVNAAFCMGENERIAGFIFFGSPGRPLEERERPSLARIVSRWQPPEQGFADAIPTDG